MFFGPSRKLAARRLEHGGPRIYDWRERWALSGLDFLLRVASIPLGLRPPPVVEVLPSTPRRILAARLDRLGDLVMTLPALAELRRLAPESEIELAVGAWNEPIARRLPFVDRVRVVDVPGSARSREASWVSALRAMKGGTPPELAIDFQGDVRALLLLALTRARFRLGYPDTGGRYLLTHRARWNEKESWYRQNVRLLQGFFPEAALPERIEPLNFLLPEDRHRCRELLEARGWEGKPRPHIGIHPSAGRPIKQWEPRKFAELADRLKETTGGTILLTGGPSDRNLVDDVASLCRTAPTRWIEDAGVRVFTGAIERMDLFITGDTGPMHLANAVGTPTVTLFGPSDPVRYGPEQTTTHRIVRHALYCSPCNMIRRPPRECSRLEAPECLQRVSVEEVMAEAVQQLNRLHERSGS